MDIPTKPWPTGLAEQCEPLVRRVLAPNASHYTFTGTQTYLIGAGNELAVIDPGPADSGSDADPSPFKGADTNGRGHVDAILAAAGSARISTILCTHTHRDHSPAAAALKASTGARIIGCAPLALDDDGPRADSSFDHTYTPDRVLADRERIAGPDWTIEAVATPGHTSNHLCYALVESGALFTGDHVMAWSTSVVSPPDGDMSAYMASLQKLYDRDDRVFYPAHGPAVTKPRQLVRGMLGHRRQREGQILRLLAKGPQRITEMVPIMYKGLDPRLNGAAGRSVLAHLIDLERQHRVTCREETWSLQA